VAAGLNGLLGLVPRVIKKRRRTKKNGRDSHQQRERERERERETERERDRTGYEPLQIDTQTKGYEPSENNSPA